MPRQLPKLLLLVGLLATFVISSAPAFATSRCQCFVIKKNVGGGGGDRGCQLNKDTLQCVNTGCKTFCY